VLPTVAPRSSTIASFATPSRLTSDRVARAWALVTMTRSTSAGVSSACLSASLHARSPSATYLVSPKRSSHTFERTSPGARQRSRNSAVIDAAPMCSASSGADASSPTSSAAAPSPPEASSAPPGKPVRMSAATTSTVSFPARAIRSAPTAERCAPPRSRAATSSSRRNAAWMAVALVLSR